MGREGDAGLLLVGKPEGPTSHDIVERVRAALGGVRVGHTGTLDPFASGLLILCVGWATRLAEYLTLLPKVYRATLRLGARTDTDDRTGRVVRREGAWSLLDRSAVEAALRARAEATEQRVPAYSARRQAGVRLYRLARRGAPVDAPWTSIRVYRLDLLEISGPDVTFEIECSAGTYLRAFARDVGEDLGVGAHLRRLRRLAIGAFRVEEALAERDLRDRGTVVEALRPPEDAVAHLPRIDVAEPDALRVARGQPIGGSAELRTTAPVAILHEGRLVGIGDAADAWVRPVKVFCAPGA
ncbi:MAG: tRNA pseudouridine(55) synthase TruB [Gemmatimonadetes bacterium]|nr:tRNA pseudouridine(55) synthase TruB [Gemmatimonadota bacterium]